MTVSATSPSVTSTHVHLGGATSIDRLTDLWGLVVAETDVAAVPGVAATTPRLRLPVDLPPEIVMVLIGSIAEKLSAMGVATRIQSVQINEVIAADLREGIIDKLLKAIDSAMEAAKAAKEKAIVDWILIGLGLILAIVAVVATGGALAPALAGAVAGITAGAVAGGAAATVGVTTQVMAVLALSVAVLGATMATMEFINSVIKHTGHTHLDINGKRVATDVSIMGFIQACIAQAIASGDLVIQDEQGRYLNAKGEVDTSIKPKPGAQIKTQAEVDRQAGEAAMALMIALAVSMVVAGVGGTARAMIGIEKAAVRALATADKTSSIGTLIHAMDAVAVALETMANLGQGAVQIGSSVLEINYANSVKEQAEARADKAYDEARLEVILQQMNFDRDEVNRVMQQFAHVVEQVAAMLQQLSDSMGTVARNTATTATV